MAPTAGEVSVKHLMEIASENNRQRNKSSNVSLTPLQSSSATNAEEALRLNKRRSRLTLQIKVLCEQTHEANKRIKILFWIICLVLGILCLIFMFRVQEN